MLRYLEQCIRNINDPLYKEREALLGFLDELLEVMRERLADYVVEMKRVCFDTYRRDYKSNTLRTAALQVRVRVFVFARESDLVVAAGGSSHRDAQLSLAGRGAARRGRDGAGGELGH